MFNNNKILLKRHLQVKVAVVFLLLINSQLFSQVITNTGAYVKVGSGSVVVSHELENSSGTFRNEGTLNLSNELRNQGNMLGNGFYNLKGDWIDFGIFDPEHSHVTMDGTVNQTIRHNGSGESFYNLTLNSPGRTFTHISLAGGTIAVGNNLNLLAGTLNLDLTTSFLTVGGTANIAGSLIYNASTAQTASIIGPLQGAGTIDMRNGDLAHILNLAGATNSIGTFLTGPGASIVNYNGTNQTVFPAMNYRHLIISNSGIKVLQGNSLVGLDMTISGGTFDLGTVPTSLQVIGNSSITGSLAFNGTTAKTVNLSGDLSGTGSIDMSGGNLAHVMNLNGISNNIGSYSSGNNSTVFYIRNADQTVFPSNDYRNMTILGSGMKTLLGDVNAKGKLTMSSGSISTNSFILDLTNQAVNALVWTNGTIIGKFRRAVGTTGAEYLYPVGATTSHNPFKITFQNLTAGSVMAQFRKEDIGTLGLPLDDDGNEIYERYPYGFWTLTSSSPSLSSNYSIKVDYDGFLGVDASASIIKRTNNGNLEIDGTHGALTADDLSRNVLVNGISPVTTDFAIGRGRPRITRQPANIDVCEGSPAYFELKARGRGSLLYQWEVSTNGGATFASVMNGGVYSGATTDHLDINPAPYGMNGYLYRCIITDAQGHFNVSTTVLLTVNKIPQATATTPAPECPGIAFDNILLGTANGVAGTTFAWTRTNPAGITTTLPLNDIASGDMIPGVFNNTTDAPITIVFTIIPTGPATTFCVGSPINVSVTVNPTPKVFALPANSTQCDSTLTNIHLSSPSTFTSGAVTFRYTVTATDNVTGFTTPTTGLTNAHDIKDLLVNHTNSFQTVTYRVVPMSPVGCVDGQPKYAQVIVNPTPKAEPLNNLPAICYGGTTQIILTSPTSMTTGNVVLNYTVTAGPGVTGNMSPESNRINGYTISRSYNNDSPGLQSVYYTITPVNNSICKAGPKVVSEVKVHAKAAQEIVETKPFQCTGGGASFGALKAILSTGAAPFHIEWTGPDNFTAEDIVELMDIPSGWYGLKVTDNLGCTNALTKDFYPPSATPILYVRPYAPGNGYGLSCIGASDGRITAYVKGVNTAPYRYYLVRDDRDTVGNGIFTDNYDSGNPATYRLFTGLSKGSYKLFTIDKNNCSAISQTWDVVPPPAVNVTFGKIVYPGGYNITCRTYNDGAAWVQTISGGRGFYKYSWSTIDGSITGPVNTNRINSITAGTYTLLVTDTLNCTTPFNVVITQPTGMNLDNAVLSKSADNNYNVSCNGGSDGSIDLTISGGSGNYTYDWTGPGGIKYTTQDISGLKAGTYTCIISDINGCKLFPPAFTLTEPAPLSIASTKSVSNDGNYSINCYGGTGSVSIIVTGGSTGNYTYTWSTVNGSGIVQGQQNQSTLRAGTYHLEVKDMNGCGSSADITLTEPPALNLQLSARHITCESPGFDNGAVDLTTSGGTGPLTYLWSNGPITPDISGLTAGVYTVSVTYNNTCVVQGSAEVKMPPKLTFSSSFSNYRSYEISCFGRSDGEIHITPTSGKAPFTYSWSGPGGNYPSSKDMTGLTAGTYNLHITDSNKCTVTESVTLREPGRLSVRFAVSQSLTGGYNLNCAGDSTGTITVNPQNSVNNVKYIWSDGFNGRTRTNLAAGEYNVIITDDNNCQAQGTTVLTEPDSIKLAFEVKQPFCPDMPDGEIRLTATGGLPGADYVYKWSDKSTGRNLSGIPMGLYSVKVEDLNRCIVKDSLMLMPQNEACLIVPNIISPNGDLINDYWNIGMKELYPEMEIKIYNRLGEMVWRSAKGYPDPWDGRRDGLLLPIDSYHYVIDLHNGSKVIIGNVTIVK